MTEAEWLGCKDPQPMLEFLRGKASDRKLRLFAVACCRRLSDLPGGLNDAWRHGIDVAEEFAEGGARKGQLERTHHDLLIDLETVIESDNGEIYATKKAVLAALYSDSLVAARTASAEASRAVGCWHDTEEAQLAEERVQAALLRDIFSSPFRSAPADSSWLTPEVASLARDAYEEFDFANRVARSLELWWKQDYPEGQSGAMADQMADLADALERAACTDPDILAHCRGPGPHVRGCWMVDLILGTE